MDNLQIEGTRKTPGINFQYQDGVLEFKGKSIPENPIKFYSPVIEWLDSYAALPQSKTVVKMSFEYFNTASSSMILKIFKMIEALQQNGNEVTIKWFYEQDDEFLLEAGEDYKSLVNVPFEFVEVPEFNF